MTCGALILTAAQSVQQGPGFGNSLESSLCARGQLKTFESLPPACIPPDAPFRRSLPDSPGAVPSLKPHWLSHSASRLATVMVMPSCTADVSTSQPKERVGGKESLLPSKPCCLPSTRIAPPCHFPQVTLKHDGKERKLRGTHLKALRRRWRLSRAGHFLAFANTPLLRVKEPRWFLLLRGRAGGVPAPPPSPTPTTAGLSLVPIHLHLN